ncbi:MAG: class I SAM-dependent rRNA methyltransferase [Rhodobacteraceae bacterium]|nr:class I SAM-dependent rRNA methyltransferase [Paracoccaceae bacterium]
MTHPSSSPDLRMRPNKSPQRVRFGYPWIFADELVLDRRSRAVPAGSIVEVQAHDGERLGLFGFNAESRIAARLLDRNPDAVIDAGWFAVRLQHALDLRERLYAEPFYRLIHAEADGLPGLIIDRFGDVAAIQPNAAWAEARIGDLAAALAGVTGVTTIIKNGTGRTRALEGLADEALMLAGDLDAPVPVRMNGATYFADLLHGQKTGLFFDQRDNHAFAARLAKGGRVLDVFAHVGGFALAALAAGAVSAEAVDGSQPALDLAERGAVASGFAGEFAAIRGDAFEVMADMAKAGRRFDMVVCDPPAFAPNRNALEAGLRAYEKVARLGASLVAPGGFLCVCSCSHAADLAKFREVSTRGIGKAGRAGPLIHIGSAGPDHPLHPQLAESGYLKALFFRLD